MTTRFRRGRGGVAVLFDESEAPLLRSLFDQLLELLDDDDDGEDSAARDDASAAPADPDPLATAIRIGTATEAPDDPVLARLLPDAYTGDAEAAGEFRRYTEPTLRDGKRSDAEIARRTLDRAGARIVLGETESQAWLRSLTDLRLSLGTRLGVEQEWDEDTLADDDPRRPAYAVYLWLGWLQETLVRALW